MDMPMPSSTSMPDMDMKMKMYFHIGYEPYILIKQWVAESDGAMFGWCLFFFTLALLYELLKYYRQIHLNNAECRVHEVQVDHENGHNSNPTTQESPQSYSEDDKTGYPLQRAHRTKRHKIRMLSIAHLVQTALHMLQIFISYLLMLSFMLFNIWICLSVILGAGFGYFLIGYRKVSAFNVYDEDHCHL